jgi:antitoxin HicB
MGKSIDDYVSLPYHYLVHQEENADGPYWAARVAEISGISGSGATAEEALASIRAGLALWVEDALEDGRSIPEPAAEATYSGQFRLRLPTTVHRDLAKRADQEGVSLNMWATTVLAKHGT